MGAASACSRIPRVARRLCGAVLAGLLVVLVGVPNGYPGAVAAPREPAPVSIPSRYLEQPVSWDICPFDEYFREVEPRAPLTLCTWLTVPMDWQHPDDHPDISVAVAFSKATGYSKGLLTSNPGGPGASGLGFTGLLALSRPELFRDFDLLGFDPRGFGDSERLRCYTTQSRLDALPEVEDPRVRNVATHRAEVATARLLGDACSGSELSRYVGTQQTVWDLEFLRQFVGRDRPHADRLNYIGYSYGTWLGSWYTDSYPGHTGRFVLDSNMNWTSTMYANQTTDSYSFQRRRDKMFYPWVARHHASYGLGSTTRAVARSYEEIRAGLLAARRRGHYVPSPADADNAILTQIYTDWQFTEAATTLLDLKALAEGAGGMADRRARTDAVLARAHRVLPAASARRAGAAAEEPVEIDGAPEAVRCNDSRYPHDIGGLLRRADQDARRFRFVGYLNTVSMCSYWPYPPLRRNVDLAGAPTLLMIQSEGDPATAYEGARVAHRRTSGQTRLVSVDDEGQHGLYIDGPSPCAERIGDDFLLRGRLPRTDVVCTTSPLPQDQRVYRLDGPLDGRSYPAAKGGPGALAEPRPNPRLRAARAEVARLAGG